MAVASFSCAVLLAEITLTRIFSVTLRYHFAFLVLSIALFGLGAGGIFHFVSPYFKKRPGSLALLALTAGFVLPVCIRVVLGTPFSPQLFTLETALLLLVVVSVSALPFFICGLFISLLYLSNQTEISRLYGFDLMGAALGCISAVVFLETLGAMGTPWVAASLFGLAGVLVPTIWRFKEAAAVLLLLFVAVGAGTGWLRIEFVKGDPEGSIEFERWNAFSRVAVSDLGDRKVIHIDADAATDLFSGDWIEENGGSLLEGITGLAYQLRQESDVLIIGSGGGRDIVAALEADNRVVAVEVNPIITDALMLDRYFEFSGGLYGAPGVEAVLAEARTYLERTDRLFDVIQANAVDTWAAASGGGFTLSESYLYTVEAFESYLRRLTDDGILTLGRWVFAEPQQLLRIVAVALEALRLDGQADTRNHFFVVSDPSYEQGGGTPGVVLLKQLPFREDELDLLRTASEEGNFTVLYDPGFPRTNAFDRLIRSGDKTAFYASYPLNVLPPTDDRPFFFFTLRWRDVFSVWNTPEESRKNNAGLFLLILVFGVMCVATALCFVLPVLFKQRCRIRLPLAVFFLCIGLAFMMVEAVLIQRSVLFLGHPSISFLTVLCAIFLGAGLGSWRTDRIAEADLVRALMRSSATAAAGIGLLTLILPYWETLGFDWALQYRIAWLATPIFLTGTLLGRLFPMGFKLCTEPERAWAWALNGSASVLGSIIAILFAMLWGFSSVLWIAALCYAISSVASVRWASAG